MPFATATSPIQTPGPRFGFPKRFRILRRTDFRRVYDGGVRFTTPLFAAFCLAQPEGANGPKVGFTTPRALGNAVQRNRIRRRLREAVRLRIADLDPKWMIVFNPRRAMLDADWPRIQAEVAKLVERCKRS